jgi:hypothetical protein
MAVESKLPRLRIFRKSLEWEDAEVFDALLNQARMYVPHVGSMTSPIGAISVIISIVFAQRK